MSLEWHYLDSQGQEFGPFDAAKMRAWYEQGFFHVAGDSLLVRLPSWPDHKPVSEVYGGDRSAYFVAMPQGNVVEASEEPRDRSRSPRREPRPDSTAWSSQAGAPQAWAAFGGFPGGWPMPGQFPGGYPGCAPFGAAGWPGGPWGYPRPPQPGPWGFPQPGGPWTGFPPMGYGGPPPAFDRPPIEDDRDRDRDRDRRRQRDPSRERSKGHMDNSEKQAKEQAEELARLGREGLRDVLTKTLKSLYEDRIRPLSNYVKGRLKERSCPDVIVRTFADLYGQHSDLFRVEKGGVEKGGDSDEVAIFFKLDPDWFQGWVDIDSPEDPYPENTWSGMQKFLEEGHAFAGGRYGMARDLMAKNLEFLAPYTLGEVCHIVQLAIQKRKLIAYHKKMLKPMNQSTQMPVNGSNGGEKPEGEEISDMDELIKALFKTLKRHPDGLRLDRMKQMIREECSSRLNEMTFKCTKLIEVFRLEPIPSAFSLENDGKVFFLKTLGQPTSWPSAVRKLYDEVNGGKP